MKVFSIFTSDPAILFSAARTPDAIFIAIFVYFVIKIGDKIFGDKKIKWLFFILMAFWPQVVFIGGYINNDSLALMSTAMIVYAWLLGREKNWDTKSLILLGVSVGLCALSYYNAYGFILLSVIFFIINIIQKKMRAKEILKKGAVVAGVALVIAGWFFVRNAIIYNGDFLGLRTETETANMYAAEEFKPDNRITYKAEGKSPIAMLFGTKWIPVTLRSFIGVFGRMDIAMPTVIYIIYLLILGVGGLGVIYILIQRRSDKIHKQKTNVSLEKFDEMPRKEARSLFVIFGLSIIIPVVLSIYYSYASDYQPQGRYIIPMIVPLIILLTLGIKNIVDAIIAKEKTKKIVCGAISVFLAVMPIYYVFFLIIPSL